MLKVSVIVPIYNMEQYLAQCLDSVLSQSLAEIEVICINDGSTDGSGDILDQYKVQDGRVQVYHQKNIGVGPTRNRGIQIAKGEFVAFMDPDDYYPDKDVLRDLYSAAKEHNVRIAGGSFCEDHNGRIAYNYPPALQDYIFKENRLMRYEEHQFDFGYIRFIYDRKLLVEEEIFFPPYIRFQDPPFFVKAMLCAGEFYALKRFAYCYRWGHKTIDWTAKRTTDMVRGVADNIEMSATHGMAKLHKLSISRIEVSGYDAISKNLTVENLELLKTLLRANDNVDVNLLRQTGMDVPEHYVIKPLADFFKHADKTNEAKLRMELKTAKQELADIRSSRSFRLGRLLTSPFRWLRQFLKTRR